MAKQTFTMTAIIEIDLTVGQVTTEQLRSDFARALIQTSFFLTVPVSVVQQG